jgi:low temperature requirement protein LtrA
VAIVAERTLASLHGRAQAAMARDSYSYIHFFMVWGIVLVALGLKKTLVDVAAPMKWFGAVALFGGLALYLVAHVVFRLRNMGTLNVQRLVVAVVLLAAVPVAVLIPALTALSLATVLIVGLVAYEAVRFRDARHHIRVHAEDPD